MSKRIFDIVFSLLGLFFIFPVVFFFIIFAAYDTNSSGLFIQKRIGRYGKPFVIYKIRTIHKRLNTTSNFGAFIRKYKIDELPQLVNILIGEMSFVGPRPDIPGYYDLLIGEESKVLELKPGLTSEAALKYINEEEILEKEKDRVKYNDEIIFKDKVKMNLSYYYNQSFCLDLYIIFKTIFRK